MPEKTMISILRETADRLKDISLYDRETYDEIIQRLLEVAKVLDEHKIYERESYVEIIERLLKVYEQHKDNNS